MPEPEQGALTVIPDSMAWHVAQRANWWWKRRGATRCHPAHLSAVWRCPDLASYLRQECGILWILTPSTG